VTVYVGMLFPCKPTRRWRWGYAAHLFADTDGELIDFAIGMGMAASHIQFRGTWKCHYDLTEKMRAKAVKRGAAEMDRRAEIEFLLDRRPLFSSR
jgi:hypothetical protein